MREQHLRKLQREHRRDGQDWNAGTDGIGPPQFGRRYRRPTRELGKVDKTRTASWRIALIVVGVWAVVSAVILYGRCGPFLAWLAPATLP